MPRRVSLRLLALLGALFLAFPAANAAAAAATGTVRGRVTDAEDGSPIGSAQVSIVGTRLVALTNTNGDYVLPGVTSGPVTVRIVRIGYQPATQAAVVPDGGTVVANFSATRSVTRLEEVVTTATGDLARREVGNVMATLSADKLTKEAPVTNVNEILQSRIPGVLVVQGSGQVGASSSIRIRGTSSLSLSNEPIVIVDGIRYDNNAITANTTTQRVNAFSDFNPEDIETIDVIKGPSAAALYGTAAANGVIVIKTKRGTQGKTQWRLFTERGQISQPSKFEDNWQSWGRNVVNGAPTGAAIQCKVVNLSLGRCVQDSLSRNNPYTNPLTNPYKTGEARTAGVSAGGGNDLLRYFVSLTRQNEVGPYQMPDTDVKRITAERGTPPTGIQIRPNQLQQTSLRGNFSFALASKATVDVNVGYIDRNLHTPFDGGFFAGMTFQLMTAPGYTYNRTLGTQREFVGDIFSIEQRLSEQRWTGSTTFNWNPLDWLKVHSVIGIDQNHQYNYRMQKNGEGTSVGVAWGPIGREGGKDADRINLNKTSFNASATATRNLTNVITSKTTLGVQWFKDQTYDTFVEGYGLLPGATSPNAAGRIRISSEFTTENATEGVFLEEQLAWRDRLFGTFGVRQDKNSAFGRSVGNTQYPRASLSYLISDEKWFPAIKYVDRLRLRTAWGKAGVQPTTIAALQFLSGATFPIGGSEVPGLRLSSIGNPGLKPEVTTETEIGADFALLKERINVELTYFNKQSHDALFARPLPPSYGAGGSQFQNLASVENTGVEVSVDGQVIDRPYFNWNLRVGGSHLKNTLKDAGTVPLAVTPGNRQVVGYPLNGLWDRKIISYTDANGDGKITENEVVLSDTALFKGSTLPEWEAGVTNTFGFLKNTVHITAQFDYRGGFFNQWGYESQRCVSTGNCRAVNDPTAPLEAQARSVMGASSANKTIWGFFVPNDFVRFRELSVTYDFSKNLTQKYLRSKGASLSLSGRNLGVLWTKYPGLDPEANSSVANTGGGNNDFYSPPVLRTYQVRLNVAF